MFFSFISRQIEIVRPSYSRKFKQIKDFKTKFSSDSNVKKSTKLPDTIVEGKFNL